MTGNHFQSPSVSKKKDCKKKSKFWSTSKTLRVSESQRQIIEASLN